MRPSSAVLLSLLAFGGTSYAATALPCSGNVASFASVLGPWPAAQTYCTAKFPVPAKTNTVPGAVTTVSKIVATSTATSTVGATATVTAQTVTVSNTVATQTVKLTTSTTTETVTLTTTTTFVEDSTSTITATDVASSTETITTISTDTTTVTSTVTSTPYSYVTAIAAPSKRAVTTTSKPASATPKPTASVVLSSLLLQAKSFVGSVCTCIETPRTVLATASPITSVVSQTATISVTVTSQSTATITPTTTESITATSTSNVVGTQTVTSYYTESTTSTSVSFTTITATSTSVTTTTQTQSTLSTFTTTTTSIAPTETVVVKGPSCNQPDASVGVGGCSANCYCDSRPGGPPGVCDLLLGPDTCGPPCKTDNECPAGFACSNSAYVTGTCGGVTACVPFEGCQSTYTFTG